MRSPFSEQRNPMNNSNILDWNRTSSPSAFTPIHGNLTFHQPSLGGPFAHQNFPQQGNLGYNYSAMADMNTYPNFFNNQQLIFPSPMQHELYSPLITSDAGQSNLSTNNISTNSIPDTSTTSSMSSLDDFQCSNSPMILNDFLQPPDIGQELTLPMMSSTHLLSEENLSPVPVAMVQLPEKENIPSSDSQGNSSATNINEQPYMGIHQQLQEKRREAEAKSSNPTKKKKEDDGIALALKRMKKTLTETSSKDCKPKAKLKENVTKKSKKGTKESKPGPKPKADSKKKAVDKNNSTLQLPDDLRISPLDADFLDDLNRMYDHNRNLFETFANCKLKNVMGQMLTTETILAKSDSQAEEETPLFIDVEDITGDDVEQLHQLYAEQNESPVQPKKKQKEVAKLNEKDIELQQHTNGTLERCENSNDQHVFKMPQRPDEWLAQHKDKKRNSQAIVSPMAGGRIVNIGKKPAPSSAKDIYCYEDSDDESEEDDELNSPMDDSSFIEEPDNDILDMSYGN